MIRGQFSRRRRPTNQATLALVGFALICGLVLFFWGDGAGCRGRGTSDTEEVRAALKAASEAEAALESSNYGQARRMIRVTRERLGRVLGEAESGSQTQ